MMASDDGIKARMRDAALNVAVAEDEAEAVRVIMGRPSPLANLEDKVPRLADLPEKEEPVKEEPPVAEATPVPAPALLDFDGDDFTPGAAPSLGEVESDDDVTHYDEDEDPEQHIGEEVEYDLGSDD